MRSGASTGKPARDQHVVTFDTLGDRVIVRNERAGVWGERGEWRFATVWRIGVVDGDEEQTFGRLTNVSVGPDGHVYLLDFGNQVVRVFNARGTFVRRIGRRGHGPGEFDGPLGMAWDTHGHLWVADGWNRRYTVFDTDGSVVKTVPRQIRAASAFAQMIVFTSSGHFVEEAAWSVSGAPKSGYVRVDTTGAVLDTFPPLPRPPALSDMRSPESAAQSAPLVRGLRAFAPRRVHAVTKDGYIWLAMSDEIRLFQTTLAGDTVRIVETMHRNPSLTGAEERTIKDELVRSRIDASRVKLGRQVIRAIHVLDDGHVLVQIEEETGKDGRVFDVFDPSGIFLGSARTEYAPYSQSIPALRGDTLVFVTRDELDVNYVVRVEIRRSAS